MNDRLRDWTDGASGDDRSLSEKYFLATARHQSQDHPPRYVLSFQVAGLAFKLDHDQFHAPQEEDQAAAFSLFG